MGLNTIGLGFIFSSKELVSKDVGGLVKGFDTLEKAVAKFAGTERVMLRDARGRLAGIRQELTAEGKQIVGGIKSLGAGFVTFKAGVRGLEAFKPAIADASAFGKAIGEVSTLVDEAAFSTDEMRRITMSMADQFGVDAIQAAPALYQAISAGATDAAAATDLVNASNKLAIGGVTDLTTSVDVLSSAVNVYKDSGLSAADASDTLFVAIRAGKTTAGELGASLGRVLPIANSLGISFAEVNASVAAMTAGGLQTSRAVTGLNAALANIIKPTKAAKEEAKRLGIEFTAAALREKGLEGFLREVTQSSKFTDDSLSRLFGSVEGLNAITSLTSNESKKFRQVLGEMGQRAGSTDKAFRKMTGGIGFQMKRLDALKRNMRITIGEAVAPFVGILVTGLTKIVNGFNALPKPVQRAIVLLTFLTSAAVAAAGAFAALRGAVLLVGPALKALRLAALPALLPFIKIIAIVGAVIAVAALLKKAFDENIGGFGDEMRAIFADLKPAFVELKQAVVEAFKAWVDAMRPLLPVFRSILKIGIKALIFGLKIMATSFKIAAKGIKLFVQVGTTMFRTLAPGFRALGQVIAWFARGVMSVARIVAQVWQEMADRIGPIIDAIVEKVRKAVELVEKLVRGAQKAAGFVSRKIFGSGDLDEESILRFGTAAGFTEAEIKQALPNRQVGVARNASSNARIRELAGPIGVPGQQAAAPRKVTVNSNLMVDGRRLAQAQQEVDLEDRARRSD